MSTDTTIEATDQSQHDVHHDPKGSRIGMWLFLFTELLLFGGLFLLYAVYRGKFPVDFHFGASTLDTALGTVNTVVLLTSSLTMVLAIINLEKAKHNASLFFIGFTIFLGLVFMVNKYFEWGAKFHHGLYPNSKVLQSHPVGENAFYSLYYLMTGLHGLHIIIGVVILTVMLLLVRKNRGQQEQNRYRRLKLASQLENCGLYWHLVDIVWIFLFPLFYLIT